MRACRGSSLFTVLASGAVLCAPALALAYGESVNGFPSAGERLLLELTNRARVDPLNDLLTGCGTGCNDLVCYGPKRPLYHSDALNRAARFHAAHMTLGGYFTHESNCVLVQNIATIYPSSCDGAASCSCAGQGTTSFSDRVQRFGVTPSFEIIANSSTEQAAFYSWLTEPFTSSICEVNTIAGTTNGHRWALLRADGSVGFGVVPGEHYVGDFSAAVPASNKIASGAHLPGQGSQVELWANWFDSTGPQVAMVVIDGTCHPMKLERGNARNGAWRYATNGLGACARYYFHFVDHDGAVVTYPSTGTLGIGTNGCAEFEPARAATPASCTCTPTCTATACSANGCGGFCGDCGDGRFCSWEGNCIEDFTDRVPSGSSSSGTSGTSGTGHEPELAGGHFCGCSSGTGGAGPGVLLLAALLFAARRRTRR